MVRTLDTTVSGSGLPKTIKIGLFCTFTLLGGRTAGSTAFMPSGHAPFTAQHRGDLSDPENRERRCCLNLPYQAFIALTLSLSGSSKAKLCQRRSELDWIICNTKGGFRFALLNIVEFSHPPKNFAPANLYFFRCSLPAGRQVRLRAPSLSRFQGRERPFSRRPEGRATSDLDFRGVNAPCSDGLKAVLPSTLTPPP